MNVSENQRIKLSIVIAAWNGTSSLRACLASLEKQTDKTATETIVVANFQTDFSDGEFSSAVKFIKLPDAAIVPELRREGIAAARGKIVALVEDHCVFDPRWSEEIKRAHKSASIVGGSVENASAERALDWAVYFYDYGKYMLPVSSGVTDTLSGMNVSYKRELLDLLSENYENGFFETFINEELKRRGHQLYLTPSAVIFHNKNYDLKRISVQFYHQARSFAARRVVSLPLSIRFSFLLASLTLPILLPMRVVLRTVTKKRHFKELVKSAPFLLILTSVWAVGEFCGYLCGDGGSSEKWR